MKIVYIMKQLRKCESDQNSRQGSSESAAQHVKREADSSALGFTVEQLDSRRHTSAPSPIPALMETKWMLF